LKKFVLNAIPVKELALSNALGVMDKAVNIEIVTGWVNNGLNAFTVMELV